MLNPLEIALRQFKKAYYPYGVIARASVPTTFTKQLSYRLPLVFAFGYFWWRAKELPRQYLTDLSSEDEE